MNSARLWRWGKGDVALCYQELLLVEAAIMAHLVPGIPSPPKVKPPMSMIGLTLLAAVHRLLVTARVPRGNIQ